MDKEINPLLAALIILILLVPIGVWIWAAGEAGELYVGNFYLEHTPSGQLSVQSDHLLSLTQPDNSEITSAKNPIIDFSKMGIEELMGNVVYLSDEEFLVRTGAANWNWRTYFSLGESKEPEYEKLRQRVADDSQEYNSLAKCSLKTKECEPYLTIEAPWRYRLWFDHGDKSLYLTNPIEHKLTRFNNKGEVSGEFSGTLKYPKRVRRIEEGFYVVDTNNHRIQFFDVSDSALHSKDLAVKFVPPSGPFKWLVDAVYFDQHWWVINANGSMVETQLQLYDEAGEFIKNVGLEKLSEPFDMLIHKGQLLVSDKYTGLIHRFKTNEEKASPINTGTISNYISTSSEQRSYFEAIIFYMQITLAVLLLSGIIVAFFVARKHNKESPYLNKFATTPPYLDSSFSLQKSNLTGTKPQEIVMNNILISNIEIVPGRRTTAHLGLVQGSTVRAKHAGKDILAGFKNIFGGELQSYTDLLSESRQEALDRMCEQAKAVGANAVINVRFSTSSIAAGASEILAYGTAVILEEV